MRMASPTTVSTTTLTRRLLDEPRWFRRRAPFEAVTALSLSSHSITASQRSSNAGVSKAYRLPFKTSKTATSPAP